MKVLAALLVSASLMTSIVATERVNRQQVPLLETIQRQIAAREGLAWSADRRLAWEDFKATAPEIATGEAAHLEYGLFYGVRCTGHNFDFRVIAAMMPGDSWVRPSVVASESDGARTLQHEQTHFNLTEIHARKMRKYFGGLYEPCLKAEEELDTAAARFIRAEAAEQKLYDEETRNGRDVNRQKRWDADVTARLTVGGRARSPQGSGQD